MQVSAACIRCMVDRQEERMQKKTGVSEIKKAEYLKQVLRVIGESNKTASAPELVEEISKVYEAELLQKAAAEKLDNKNYECFKQDLKQAKKLTYVLDNCGEIVLDKLLIKEIKRQYPKLRISVLVRGKEVLNDVTMEDAIQTGLTNAHVR